MATALVFVAWIFSLCLHEFSHALVAYWGGDTTVKEKGYLSFNPLRYADPLLSIVYPLLFLLVGGLGLPGGCVYIDRTRLRSRLWDCAVSLAGPLSNAVLAVVLALPFTVGYVNPATQEWYWAILAFLVELQVSAVLLNLLPIPPLDGFGAIAPWLPPATRANLYRYSQQGLWIIFALFWFVPQFNHFFWNIVYHVVEFLGVSRHLGWEGYQLFKIWK
jgi:Zn-dependent protease